MNPSVEPRMNIGNVRKLICPKHEAELAADPTVNAILLPIELLQAVLADVRCQAWTGGEISKVPAFIDHVAPACEWLTPEAVTTAFRRARALGHGHRG